MPVQTGKKYVFLTAFFAAYMFEYMVTSTLLNRGATGVVPTDLQLRLYYIDMAFCVLGFILFAVERRYIRSQKVRVSIIGAVTVIYTACILQLFLIQSADVYMFIAPFTMLCLGVIGGVVYYCMSMALTDDRYMGRVMGIGGAAAVLIQYILQLVADISLGMPFILALGLVMMAYLLNKPQWEWLMHDDRAAGNEGNRSIRVSLYCAAGISMLLILLCQYYDSRIELQAVQSGFETINLYTWPRLCLVAAYLVVGCLGDFRNGRYVPLFTLCTMMLSALTPLLLSDGRDFVLSMCLFYINVGVTISYYNLIFWRLAPHTGWPQLWSGMGRILDGTIGLTMIFVNLKDLSMQAVVGTDLMLLAGVIVMMVIRGDFSLSKDDPEEEKKTVPGAGDIIDRMSEKYELTPRETEVLQKLLLTEDELQIIADSMYISRRVLSRHISAIYKKTGTKSRVGLFQLYYEASHKP